MLVCCVIPPDFMFAKTCEQLCLHVDPLGYLTGGGSHISEASVKGGKEVEKTG